MTAKKDQIGIQGVFASTSLKTGEDWRWQTHLANVPITFELEENNTDIAAGVPEITFKYADEYKNLFDLYLNNSTTEPAMLGSKSVGDSTGEFALGQCAMMQNGNWVWSDISNTDGNVVQAEDIKFLPLTWGTKVKRTRACASAPRISHALTRRQARKTSRRPSTSSTGSIPATVQTTSRRARPKAA